MMQMRPSGQRGHADHGWLQSHHSFSFGEYFDPAHMAWGNLRVINEDTVAPGGGFPTHGHRDMEIISYVLSGRLAHRDSLGNVQTIPAGDVQRMSAGRGVRHSEFNHDTHQATHFLQIWIEPSQRGIEPSYQQTPVSLDDKMGRWCLVAAPAPEAAALALHADARLYATVLTGPDTVLEQALDPQRKAYVFVVRGQVEANGVALGAGDALLLADEGRLSLRQAQQAEVLWFDLAP